MSLVSRQRRQHILSLVLERGHVTVRDLGEEMSVSEATIRRDLRGLADSGEVELVYGGATLPRASDFSFRSKSQRNVESKRVIGKLAATLVADGETLFLDSGTTAFAMAPHLKRRRGLSVIVNSARLAAELGTGSGDLSLILLGGRFRADTMDTIGPLALATLEQLRGFRLFLGADGLSAEFGVTAADMESAHLYRLAIRHARETILLADHSKFLAPSLVRICEFQALSRIVTDRSPSPEWLEFLNEQGIEILHPGSQPAPSAKEN